MFRLRTALRSDVGMRRATNQDAVVISPREDTTPEGERFLMVADGMGAHAAGELASKMAIDYVPHAFLKSQESGPGALRRVIREANRMIHDRGNTSREFHGMGTTCTCLVVACDAVLAGHVGDSRLYRLRGEVLEQLTFDHSLVWEMAAASNVSEEKVPSCIPKNVITRSLGPHEKVNIDLEGPHPIEAGDTYLLCSDGLSGVIDDPLAAGVLAAMPPDEAAQTLVDLANLRGGPDNISVIVARAEPADDAPPECRPCAGSGQASLASGAVAAAGLAGFVWFMEQGYGLGMLLSAALSGAAIAYALLRMPKEGSASASLRSMGGPYGNGPYRRCEAGDGHQAAEALRTLTDELAALSDQPTPLEETAESPASPNGHSPAASAVGLDASELFDWAPYAPRKNQADELQQSDRPREAVGLYCALVRDLMLAARDGAKATAGSAR